MNDEEQKSAYAAARLTERQRARVEAATRLDGQDFLSDFVRVAVLEKANRVLKREAEE